MERDLLVVLEEFAHGGPRPVDAEGRRPELEVQARSVAVVVQVVFLTIFVSMIGFGIVIPVLPVYASKAQFGLSPAELGWLTGIFSLVQLFTAPLLGKLSDRVGRRPVLLISIIGTAIGYFVTGAAEVWWMLFLGRIIDGASGGNIAAAQAAVARLPAVLSQLQVRDTNDRVAQR